MYTLWSFLLQIFICNLLGGQLAQLHKFLYYLDYLKNVIIFKIIAIYLGLYIIQEL